MVKTASSDVIAPYQGPRPSTKDSLQLIHMTLGAFRQYAASTLTVVVSIWPTMPSLSVV